MTDFTRLLLVAIAPLLAGTVLAAGPKTTMLEGFCVRVVRSGEVVSTPGFGDVVGTINRNNTDTTGDYADSVTAILLEDGATINVTNGASIWPALIMTNGTATINTWDSASSIGPSRCILLRGGAKLTIRGKSLSQISFGHKTYCPYGELGGLVIKRGETDISASIIIDSCARLASMPERWVNLNSPVGKNGTAYLVDDLWKNFSGHTISNLPGAHVYSYSPDWLNGRRWCLKNGMILHLTPLKSLSQHATISNNLAQMSSGFSPSLDTAGMKYAFDAALPGTNSILMLETSSSDPAAKGSSFSGTVSGKGQIWAHFGSGVTATKANGLTLAGSFDAFTGPLVVTCTNRPTSLASAVGTLVVSNDLPSATVEVGMGARVLFATDAPVANVKAVAGRSVAGSFGAADGRTLAVGTLSGAIRAADGSSIVCTSVAPGTTLVNEECVTYPAARRAFALDDDGNRVASHFAEENGTDVDIGSFLADLVWPLTYRTITAQAGARLVNVPRAAVLEPTVPLLVDAASPDVSLVGSGAVSFDRADVSAWESAWTNIVDFWFDFSTTNCLRAVSSDGDDKYPVDPARLRWTRSCGSWQLPVFERCIDWRYPEREATLWQGLHYTSSSAGAQPYTYPACATNKYQHVEGLSYMTFCDVDRGRLPFAFTRENANVSEPMPVQYAVMVYSARLGGGMSLVADTRAYFARANDASRPFVTNALPVGLAIRADGVQLAHPEVTCPRKDWQVVTLKMNGAEFRGLGFYGANKMAGNGYSEYGEVLLFTNKVHEARVFQAEQYLAKKWNLPYDDTDYKASLPAAQAAEIAASTNTVSGVGSSEACVTAGGYATYRLAGTFAGELALGGGKLVVDAELPWTEDRVAEVEGRTFWFDAEDRSSLKLLGDYRTGTMSEIISNQVRVVRDKTAEDFHSGPLMAAIGNRMPYLRREARRFGVERNWIDFYEWNTADVDPGNTLRMIQRREGENWDLLSKDDIPQTMDVRTVLFAHDSTWGGGNPVLDSLFAKLAIGPRSTVDPTAIVWRNGEQGSCAAFREGLNRINGVTQQNPNGFGGYPEVYAVRGTAAISGQYFIDYYGNSINPAVRRAADVGEILYFSSALGDADIAGIESYLMSKWLGFMPAGYGDTHLATVSGFGAIEAVDMTRLPRIATNFTGTVSVGGESAEITMTVDATTRTVEGAIVNAGATFALPAAVTIHVKFAESPFARSSHRYTLVDVAGAENTTWTVDLSDASVPRTAVAVLEDGKVYVAIRSRGMLIIYK